MARFHFTAEARFPDRLGHQHLWKSEFRVRRPEEPGTRRLARINSEKGAGEQHTEGVRRHFQPQTSRSPQFSM